MKECIGSCGSTQKKNPLPTNKIYSLNLPLKSETGTQHRIFNVFDKINRQKRQVLQENIVRNQPAQFQ